MISIYSFSLISSSSFSIKLERISHHLTLIYQLTHPFSIARISKILLIWQSPGMLRQLLKIKIPRRSASVFYGDRHKFVQPIPRPPSFSREEILSLPPSRLFADLWAYRFFFLWKPPWNFAEVEFRPDHRPSRPCLPLFISYDFLHRHSQERFFTVHIYI